MISKIGLSILVLSLALTLINLNYAAEIVAEIVWIIFIVAIVREVFLDFKKRKK